MASPRAAANRRHYERHREEIIERTTAYQAEHPVEHRKAALAYYHRNAETVWTRKEANREQISQANKVYYRRRGQFIMRMREYGLTQEVFEYMLEAQGKACAICRMVFGETKSDAPHVDHDHTTGKVRGLLCINCNFLIGHCREEPALLVAAGLYLEAQKEVI